MNTVVYIVGDHPVRLWGLSPRQRLERAVQALNGVHTIASLGEAEAVQRALLLRGDRLYDERVVVSLAAARADVVLVDEQAQPLAASVAGEQVRAAHGLLTGERPEALAHATRHSVGQIASGYNQRLRKLDPPYAVAVTSETRAALERHLFDGAYKGVVDGVTKWLWPRPARALTHWCTRLGVRPNHVTVTSLVLCVLAGLLFWSGHLLAGLLVGWLMTFLDTVDGKLARVSLTSSRFGHVLDHGMDLIHPPLWYWAWAVGVVSIGAWQAGFEATTIVWAIVAGYIGGRLAEAGFHGLAGEMGMFVWQPFDSWHRLVTARRNPNMVLLTVGLLTGRPDLGLVAVAAWHLLSTAVLWTRVAQAAWVKLRGGELGSWLQQVDPSQPRTLAERIFTRPPLRLDNVG